MVYLFALLAAVVAYKGVFLDALTSDPLFAVYGLVVCTYLVSRFALSLLYRPARPAGLEPAVARRALHLAHAPARRAGHIHRDRATADRGPHRPRDAAPARRRPAARLPRWHLRDGARLYGLYYVATRPHYDGLWVFGIAFCLFYLCSCSGRRTGRS
jgi:hypothetical protein